MSALELDAVDLDSAAWRKVRIYLDERLETLRRENDQASLDATRTALLRGRIAEIKRLIGREREAPEPQHSGVDY